LHENTELMIFERKKKTLAACEKRAKRERETKKGKKKEKRAKNIHHSFLSHLSSSLI